MGMSRLTSQSFSHGNTTCRPQPWAHSRRPRQVRLKRLSIHTHKLSLPHSQSHCTLTHWRVCHNFALTIFSRPVPFFKPSVIRYDRFSCLVQFLRNVSIQVTLIFCSFISCILYVSVGFSSSRVCILQGYAHATCMWNCNGYFPPFSRLQNQLKT